MIKRLFCAMMAGAMLLATSCENGLDEVATVNETATVSFNIGTPEIATRAYGDGTTANKLQWAVYDIDSDVYTHLAQLNGEENDFDGSKIVELELGTGNTYQVVFWAANANAPYTFKPVTKQLVVDYTNTSANDEKLDAFYASVEVRVSGAESKTVELKRPFAQLNIGTNDYENAGKAGIVPTSSKIETYAYPAMDLITGEVIGEEAQPVTFDSNVIANGLTAGVEEEEFKVSGNKYLAMAYLLVGEKETVNVTFSYTTKSGKDFSRTVGSVPVERNYRTNIYGKLLTSSMDVNVEIKPGFGGNDNNVEAPKVVAVSTATELKAALADPQVGEVVLNQDIETEGFVFAAPATRASVTYAGRDVIIDGNGNTLVYNGAPGGRIIDFTKETEGADLTIKNLTIINNVSWIERAINYNTYGTLTLENVTIESAEGCSLNYAINLPGYSDNAKVEIKDCEIWAGAQALNLWGERTTVNVNNTDLFVIDDSADEGRSVVAINNDGETIADYSVLNFIGGSIEVVYVGEGETMPSYAIRNNTAHSTIDVSSETTVVGEISNPVAIIYWEGFNQYYSSADLNAALDAAVPTHKATGVRMINNLTLPLAKRAIYGTPVAVQMKNGGVFDGCNNTLSVENPEYNAYVVETYGGTIKNLNITTPAGRGIIISSPKEDIYIDNVLVNGPGYALNTTEHNGKKLVVTNSTFKGWTSLAGLTSVSFTACTFGENTYKYWQKFGYEQDYDRLVRPYVATLFDTCVFENGFYIDLSSLAANATITLKDCVCEEIKITTENYSQYITIELPEGRTLADCVVFE